MYVNDVGWLTMFKKGILAKRKKIWNVANHYKNLKIDLTSCFPKIEISIHYALIAQTDFERK